MYYIITHKYQRISTHNHLQPSALPFSTLGSHKGATRFGQPSDGLVCRKWYKPVILDQYMIVT